MGGMSPPCSSFSALGSSFISLSRPSLWRLKWSILPLFFMDSKALMMLCFCLSASLLTWNLVWSSFPFSILTCSVLALPNSICSNIFYFLYPYALDILSTFSYLSSLLISSISLFTIKFQSFSPYVFAKTESFSNLLVLI